MKTLRLFVYLLLTTMTTFAFADTTTTESAVTEATTPANADEHTEAAKPATTEAAAPAKTDDHTTPAKADDHAAKPAADTHTMDHGDAEEVKPVGDAEQGKAKSQTCMACHSTDGNSMVPEYPKIAGQQPAYIYQQLKAFKAGERKNALMAPMAAPLSDQDMLDLAAYYSQQTTSQGSANPDLVEQGKTIYRVGVTSKGIPACMSCHGPTGHGNNAAKFPSLRAQHAAYTVLQLKNYQSGERAGDANGQNQIMMRQIAQKMSEQDMQAAATYIQGLKVVK